MRASWSETSDSAESALAEHYAFDAGDRRIALHHVDAIVRARRIDFAEVLGFLRCDELKSIYEALGLDARCGVQSRARG